MGKIYIDCNEQAVNIAQQSVNDLLDNKQLHKIISSPELALFNITQPKLMVGDIASGDQFISNNNKKCAILKNLPTVLCVEMEGAAVAQVCFEYDIPFIIVRTISDAANEQAHINFSLFISTISSRYAVEIIKNIYSNATFSLLF